MSNEERKKLIDLVFNKGMLIKEAARILDINYKTAAKICRVFVTQDRTEKKIPERKKKFGPELDDHVRAFYSQRNLGTLEQCRKYLIDNFNESPSVALIHNVLKRIRFTLKDAVLIPTERNSERTIKLRKTYVAKFMRLESANANFVYLDEFGCKLSLRRRKGYSLIGTPCHINATGKRGNNLSVCAALDINGPIVFRAKFHAYNHAQFIEFLEMLKTKLDMSKTNVIIMDNASFHKKDLVLDWFKNNSLRYLFLPPYSPMLNPIEECFSKVKNEIKKLLYDGRDLLVAVEEAFRSVTEENCRGWFGHIKQFFPQCINEQPITNIPEAVESSGDEEEDSAQFDEILGEFEDL